MNNSLNDSAMFFFSNSGTSDMTLEVRGSTFENLDNQAITAAAGGTGVATTGTLTTIIGGPNASDRNFFQNARAFSDGGVNLSADNNVGILVGSGAVHNAIVENNLFDNIAEDGRIANTSIIRTQNNGGQMTATILNNTIQNINYDTAAGGRHVIGHVFEPAVFNASDFSNIIIDGNTATNVTYTNTNREFIFVDFRPNASGGKVIITDNNFNMPSAGAQPAIELRFRQTNASTTNVLVDNNGQGTGAIFNTAVAFLDIDAEDAATVNATVTNNEFTNTNATPGFAISVASEDPAAAGGPPTLNLSITGNDLDAAGNTIELNESAGDFNVTQASAAAVEAANGGATVTVGGTPDFNQPAPTLPTTPLVPLLAAGGGAVAGSITSEEFLGAPIDISVLPAGKTVTLQWQATVDPQANQLIANPVNTGTVSASNPPPAFPDANTNTVITTLDTLSLGGTIWNDLDGDGQLDAGEGGINGALLTLFADTGTTTGAWDAGDTLLAITTTAGGGNYAFTGLAPGDYIVRVDQANFEAAGALFGTPISSVTIPEPPDPDNNVDNDDNGARVAGQPAFSSAITLAYNTEPTAGTGNDTNTTLDFAFRAQPANQAPVADNDTYDVNEDNILTVAAAIGVLDGDIDGDGDQLTAVLVSGPAHGGLTLSSDGAFTYTPNPNFNGPDSFTYRANDGTADSNVATVSITVNSVNDAPVANPDTGVAGENETKSFDVLANDTDVDANDSKTLVSAAAVSVSSSNGAVNGIDAAAAISIVGDQVQFSPGTLFDPLNAGETATVSVVYTMHDGSGAPATSTLTLTVNGADDFNVINGTPGKDLLKGTAAADQINAMAGHDIVDAKGGDDRIVAGAGNDLVLAGSGNDTVVATVNDGNDVYHGDGGTDTFDFSQTSAAATVKLGTTIFGHTINDVGSAKSAEIGSDVLLSFENVIGGSAGDTITGDNGANVLSGGGGNDTLSGLGGSDSISGDAGDDRMTGGTGTDTFLFKPGFGNDRITDFDSNPAGGQDFLDITAFGIASAIEFEMRVDIHGAGADTLVTIDDNLAQTIRLVGTANTIMIDDFRYL